jgi:hypothetical protein
MVKNNFMIKQLLQNELFVKQLELIAEELDIMKETKGDFSFFLPKLILNIEGLMKKFHPIGSNTFDYMVEYDEVSVKNAELKRKYIEDVDANNKRLRDVEYRVWQEGSEKLAFENVKQNLGILENPSVEIENEKNIQLWQTKKN